MKLFSLSAILLLSALTASAEVVMVSGTIYDVGKGSHSSDSNVTDKTDSNLCWAATASNLLQYWQDRYLLAKETSVPNGFSATSYTQPTGTQYLNIFNAFVANFVDKGGSLGKAIDWYANGEGTDLVQGADDGAYLSSYGVKANTKVWSDGNYSNAFHSMAEFKELLDKAFKYEGCGAYIGIETSTGGHAITCWGYEADGNGNVTALYIADSDDGQFGARKMTVTQLTDGSIALSSDYGNYSDNFSYTINQISYISSTVGSLSERSNNTLLPTDGAVTTATDLSGQSITRDSGISMGQGSMLVAAGTKKTTLTLDSSESVSSGVGITVGIGSMLALDNADVTITRFSSDGMVVAAETRMDGGTVSITGNGACGVALYGIASDAKRFMGMSRNTSVSISGNASHGVYVEGQMLLDNNTLVSISGNTGAGLFVTGSADSLSKNYIGRSTLELIGNGLVEISGNKAGGILVESSVSGGSLYAGTATFGNNGTIRIENNSSSNGGGVYANGSTSISGNTGSVVFDNNTATGNGGAVYVAGYGAIDIDNNASVTISGSKAVNGSAIYSTRITSSGALTGGATTNVSLNGNTTVSVTGNESSGADVVYNQGDVLSISNNGSVEFSGNKAGTGFVIHNARNIVQSSSGGYFLSTINPVVEIARNGSVTFSNNTASYDIHNEHELYLCADKGQSITFQHGFKNAKAKTLNFTNGSSLSSPGGITYIGVDASGNKSSGAGTYIFADNGKSVIMETTVATVNAGGGMLFEDSALTVSNAKFSDPIKFTLEGSSLKLSDIAFTSDAAMTVDFGYFGDSNKLTWTDNTANVKFDMHLSVNSSSAVPRLASAIDTSTGLETAVYGNTYSSVDAIKITLSDYFDTKLLQLKLSLVVDGWVENSTLAIDTTGFSNVTYEFVTTEGYTWQRTNGDVIYYAAKAAEDMPEPTTGTLSMLALVALAARRRRKAA